MYVFVLYTDGSFINLFINTWFVFIISLYNKASDSESSDSESSGSESESDEVATPKETLVASEPVGMSSIPTSIISNML